MDRFWRASLFALMAGLLLSTSKAPAAFPEESLHSLDMARNLVAAADWSSAIEAYRDHLTHLTTRDFRDKKSFVWILEAYEKHAGEQPDYEALKTLAKAKLPAGKAKPDPILTWRLHHLLALVAQRQGDTKEAEKQLDLAIGTYPDIRYALPEQQSLLQHLYNELALSKAKTDVDAAEKYFVDSFTKDARFDYVYLAPWQKFYEAAGTPERYPALRQRIIEAYSKKAESAPAKADAYTHYRRALETEAGQQKPGVIFGNAE